MTRPTDAKDSLRRAVEVQRAHGDALKKVAAEIAQEREAEAAREPESESAQ
jgi:hypothetical protein